MATYGSTILPQRPRSDFEWEERFLMRQLLLYGPEDTRVAPLPGQDFITTFLELGGSSLDPPCFNFEAVRDFLRQANAPQTNAPATAQQDWRLALIDDRRDPAGIEEVEVAARLEPADMARDGLVRISGNRFRRFSGQRRDWESLKYAEQPPTGDSTSAFRRLLTVQGLQDRLQTRVCFLHN